MHMKLKLLEHFNNKSGGRNKFGRQTVFTIGGGMKRKYRFVDFKRNVYEDAFIIKILRDSNRSAFIALVCYNNGVLSYVLAAEKMKYGMKLSNFQHFNENDVLKYYKHQNTGNVFKIRDLSAGCLINNVALYPENGGVFARAAGTWLQIVKKYNDNYVQVKMRSGEQRLIHKECVATLGIVSNPYHNQNKLTKAGQNRLLGNRPRVRGIAMNPVDHPHGGRTNGGTSPKTPWGILTKGSPTRKRIKTDSFIIISTRKSKKI